MLYYCLVKKNLKKTIAALVKMVCVRVVGLHVPSSCLLWFSTAASSLEFTRPAHSHLLSLTLHSNRFSSSTVQKTKCSSQLAVLI